MDDNLVTLYKPGTHSPSDLLGKVSQQSCILGLEWVFSNQSTPFQPNLLYRGNIFPFFKVGGTVFEFGDNGRLMRMVKKQSHSVKREQA